MDINWIFEIMRSPYIFLFLPFLIGYFCWKNVYDFNDLADCIDSLGSNRATIFISYQQDINENLTVPPTITLKFIHGGSLNVGKYSIRNATYEWISSPSAANEFYLRLAATGGDPGIDEPPIVYEDEVVMFKGTLGSLAIGEWNWGDNDTLGYNTVYVRIAGSADPDGKAEDYVEAAYKVTINGSVEVDPRRTNPVFEGTGYVSYLMETLNVKGRIKLRGERTPQPIVTFTIDDYQNTAGWVDLFNSKGIKGVANLNVHANVIVDPTPWLTLQDEGWEIAAHSKTHVDLTTLTEEEMEDEIGGSKIALENLGFNVRNFCSPFGAYNDLTLKIIRKYYIGHTAGATARNTPPFRMDLLRREGADADTLAQLKTIVDDIIPLKGWMIVAVHDADAPKLTKIGDLIDYIQGLGIQILTLNEAEDLIGNLVDSPSFKVGGMGEIAAKLPILQNICSNSPFGCWSRSDVNKGLGVVKFDIGTTAPPAVGAVVTGANGAKARAIRIFVVSDTWGGNTATGYIELGACGLDTNTTRFADNEVLSYAGGSIKVNYPNTIAALSVTAITIAFNDANPDTIVDSGAGFGSFANGDVVEVYGSKHNDGIYWVATEAAGTTLTLHANESLITETEGNTITIVRRGIGDLIRNGGFAANTNGWTAGAGATLASVGGGQVGNCLRVTCDATPNRYGYQNITGLTIGKIYTVHVYFEKGTATGGYIKIGTTEDGAEYKSWTGLTDVAMEAYTHTFEATATNVYITFGSEQANLTALFDEVSLYVITPCYTFASTYAGFDGWGSDTTMHLYREHLGSKTKGGSFYALKCVPSVVNDYIRFPHEVADGEYAKYRTKTVTFGIFVKAFLADHVQLSISDGINKYSSYHTGGGDWEWLEVSHSVRASSTGLRVYLFFSLAGEIDGSTIAYVSQPMFIVGPSIGEGNFSSRPGEWVQIDIPIPLNSLSNKTGFSDVGWTDLNLEAESEGKIPKGAKALLITAQVNDSGSSGIGCYLVFRRGAGAPAQLWFSPYGLADNAVYRGQGIIHLDYPGDDLSYKIEASNGGTFDIPLLEVFAVKISD